MTRPVRIGTRGSALARRQTDIVMAALRAIDPSLDATIEVIRTQGDDQTDIDLAQLPSEGIFVRRIEGALLSGEIDLAVHSFKDMPSIPTEGLTVGAFLAREDPRDALVARGRLTLDRLAVGATVGTGSPRRQALLRAIRPDLDVQGIRGNVDTRLRRVTEGSVDAVVLAMAGLTRLGLTDHVTEALGTELFVPAAGQGVIAVQTRINDPATLALLVAIDDRTTRLCADAERAVAIAINAGCQTPFGVFASAQPEGMRIDAFLAPGDGRPLIRVAQYCPTENGQKTGAAVGRELLDALNVSVR